MKWVFGQRGYDFYTQIENGVHCLYLEEEAECCIGEFDTVNEMNAYIEQFLAENV